MIVAPEQRRPWSAAAKRALDVTLSAAGLVALSPALLALAAAIRLDSPGPALFVQERVGRRGEVFRLLKFRTMTAGAPVQFNADGSTRVDAQDARVTRLGHYLRGAPDELPQLINVLKGEMSLVGPRPDMPIHEQLYSERDRSKLLVRPGITSLAAVLGRNDLPVKTRFAIDVDYVERWSLGLDLKILLQTFLLPFGYAPFDFEEVTTRARDLARPAQPAHDGAPSR